MFEPKVEDTDNWDMSSTGSTKFDLDSDADKEPAFEATSAPKYTVEPPQPAWVPHLLDEGLKGWNSANSCHKGPQNLQKDIRASGNLLDYAKAMLNSTSAHSLDLPTFVYAISAFIDLMLADKQGFLNGHPNFLVIC
jgi:hypothetical protein